LAERCFDEHIVQTAMETLTPDDTVLLTARAAWLFAHDRAGEAVSLARQAISALKRPSPVAGFTLVVAAELLQEGDLARMRSLLDDALLRDDDIAGRANVMLASAIRERRFGDGSIAASRAANAAILYRRLGWPLYEAHALEESGDVAAAVALYARCAATAHVHRLSGQQKKHASRLSPRERSVAELISGGLANAVIADRLGIGTKTVEKHVASLFMKLDVRSRAEVAAAFTRGDLDRSA
ncbi:MAG: helix-turn-helix transcriptional regulator, partial [Candidatus Eremiobacteraeota bacterium]|nr:helix-turn-helix transcriptional regulator [Candidatus Eremiobacteraeota bacterium]